MNNKPCDFSFIIHMVRLSLVKYKDIGFTVSFISVSACRACVGGREINILLQTIYRGVNKCSIC